MAKFGQQASQAELNSGSSQNRTVNAKGKLISKSGGPNRVDLGMDLGPNATNVIKKAGSDLKTPVSPSANAQSANNA